MKPQRATHQRGAGRPSFGASSSMIAGRRRCRLESRRARCQCTAAKRSAPSRQRWHASSQPRAPPAAAPTCRCSALSPAHLQWQHPATSTPPAPTAAPTHLLLGQEGLVVLVVVLGPLLGRLQRLPTEAARLKRTGAASAGSGDGAQQARNNCTAMMAVAAATAMDVQGQQALTHGRAAGSSERRQRRRGRRRTLRGLALPPSLPAGTRQQHGVLNSSWGPPAAARSKQTQSRGALQAAPYRACFKPLPESS